MAFFSTGDELTGIGQPLSKARFDSNRYTIFGMLKRLDAISSTWVLSVTTLTCASRSATIRPGRRNLTSGGVSVGEADYMKQLLNELGRVVF